MINLTEYSNTSPASAAETVPEERSTTGAPASAASSTELITTDDESETPLRVIVPVLLLSLPRVITVSPSILEATSTLDDPPEVKVAGAPEPLNVIVSLVASKSEIMTLPSSPVVTELPEKVTS